MSDTVSFELGINDHLTMIENKQEFSSSGDEFIRNLEEVEEANERPENSRFGRTTEEERNRLLEGADSTSTKHATKNAVTVFKSTVYI